MIFQQTHPTDVFISPSYLQTQNLPTHQSFFSRSHKLEDLVEQQEMLNSRLNGSFSLATQEGDLLACTFLIEPIAKLFNALHE